MVCFFVFFFMVDYNPSSQKERNKQTKELEWERKKYVRNKGKCQLNRCAPSFRLPVTALVSDTLHFLVSPNSPRLPLRVALLLSLISSLSTMLPFFFFPISLLDLSSSFYPIFLATLRHLPSNLCTFPSHCLFSNIPLPLSLAFF